MLHFIYLIIQWIIWRECLQFFGKNIMDPEEEQMSQLMRKLEEKHKKKQQTQNINKPSNAKQSRKKDPVDVPANKHLQNIMDIQQRKVHKLKFQDLPEEVEFYVTQIYDIDKKRLYLTGIMENGQSLSVIANQSWKQLYFVLKDEDPQTFDMSQSYLKRAEQQIRVRLQKVGLRDNQYHCEMVQKQYVFEIDGVPRNMRYYCKVRYSFKQALNSDIEPTWQGQTFRYVFGTTYTPLQLLIINRGIKGPCWLTLKKQLLRQNTRQLANGLCVQIDFSEAIQVNQKKKQPPFSKVLSFSLKSVIPSQVSTKKYFPTERKDQTHIYAISYHFCDSYRVNIKEQKPKLTQRTYFLQTLDRDNSKKQPFVKCKTQSEMIGRFLADVVRLDPDFIVCHDSSKILDTLVCRLPKLSGDKNIRSKFGRLNTIRDLSKINQYQRINKFIAGRLLVDTYLHAKQMIKQIDYELATISEHVKGDKKFVGISDQQAKVYLSTDKPLLIINKCAEQSQLTFNLMNHLEIIQMTRQLSNICGNLWKRSLENKRAERNQFFIMHQCFDRDLIIPDKFKKMQDQETQVKKKYQGGMVIEPKKGFKSDYILLLDFNSLYPSIIREYNVCFSAIDRPRLPLQFYYRSKTVVKKGDVKQKKNKQQEIDEQNPEQDQLERVFNNAKNCKNKQEWGFLPQIIDRVVEKRKKCKNLMKKAKNPSDKKILDIQQKCYKLVANSIYGCLGFSVSRFYSRPLAALITKKGRDSLMAARQIAMKRGLVDVIYGDTDSIMLQPLTLKNQQNITQQEKLKLLKKVADELKKQINNQYTFLEIDIDGIFKPLILLMKKKYVANKLVNFEDVLEGKASKPQFNLQYKGIELVRRDGCKIARDTQQDIIKILVRTDDSQLDDRFNEIHEYFIKLKDQLRNKPKSHFLFSKQLSKNPKDYTQGNNMPHVKVALDLVKAGHKQDSLINHTIYYLICRQANKDYRNLAEQAYDMKNYEKIKKFQPQLELEIDYEHYKQAILEPVVRLLVSIDKDKVVIDRLSEALGIQHHRKKAIYEKCEDNQQISTEKFGEVICQSSKNKSKQLSSEIYQVYPHQIQCPNTDCKNKTKLVDIQKNHTLMTRCSQCQTSLAAILYNIIRYRINSMVSTYYSNKKRCHQCSKNYDLDLIGFCCPSQRKAKNKPKDQISFRLHNLLYLCKQVAQYTLQSQQKITKQVNDEDGIRKVLRMIDNFLDKSEYEDIKAAMCRLSV